MDFSHRFCFIVKITFFLCLGSVLLSKDRLSIWAKEIVAAPAQKNSLATKKFPEITRIRKVLPVCFRENLLSLGSLGSLGERYKPKG
jgi:hypothetical protein